MSKTTHTAPAALVAGSTGLIGRELVAQWPQAVADAGLLHLLVRRKRGPPPRGQVQHVVDFAALPMLPPAQQAYCCLGTTLAVAGSPAAFRVVDFDAVLAFAWAARQAGVSHFAVVSSLGANPRSGALYSRVKGEMEQALQGLGFESLVIARPSLLAGNREALGQPARRGEKLALALARPLEKLIPLAWRPIEARTVALAMLRALQQARPGVQVLESAALQRLGTANQPST